MEPPRPPRDLAVPDALAGRTVLVTGGAGFVGSHLAEALASACRVRVLDDLSAGRREQVPAAATLIEGDVLDDATLDRATAGVDAVFHQAGLVSVEASVEAPARSHAVNAQGTVEVLERARREDARVVFASSAAVYGEPDGVPVHESDSKTPRSPYGASKLAADHFVRLAGDLYGLETVALRYFNVYGPRGTTGDYSGVIGVFRERARAGEALPVHGDGGQTRDFVHVVDVVRANLQAATTDATGRAYNVGTGEPTAVAELAETVRRLSAGDPEIVHTDPRPGDVRHSVADVGAARRALGYEPTVELEAGLASLP